MTEQRVLGHWRGVAIEIALWDGAAAEVELSIACMFERELGDAGPMGGLRHLDQALDGALTALRREGSFRAAPLETLLISRPPAAVAAPAVAVIGLGDPTAWSPALTAQAAAAAVRLAVQQGATSAAFAPSLLDAGLDRAATGGVATAMLDAVIGAIDVQSRLVARGLASPFALRRWVFDVGAAGFAATAERFQASLVATYRAG
ncbi:M17 family peptidase N-terminal domain-containing protein [Frateuria defendens]|uniref:M17 family peptidase N-terminal domain-containing protein n=1 Tax=Frateuria defendens TaxID=2219559 RepID=UPI00066FE836|nr:M17 family peptidase N-terminal domain-containing protein [Frateuria defendens]